MIDTPTKADGGGRLYVSSSFQVTAVLAGTSTVKNRQREYPYVFNLLSPFYVVPMRWFKPYPGSSSTSTNPIKRIPHWRKDDLAVKGLTSLTENSSLVWADPNYL